jgi:hypothetical protein
LGGLQGFLPLHAVPHVTPAVGSVLQIGLHDAFPLPLQGNLPGVHVVPGVLG